MVNYYSLGGHKRLHEIVVAGSHDAGITGGAKHVKTQSADIGGQARAGVRVFDLRVAAAKRPAGPRHKRAELRAFHADPKLMTNETKTRHLRHGGVRQITRTKLSGGAAFGLGLSKMLRQARKFVESANGQNEFLILKFDKCLNWEPIAELCIQRLGDRLYQGRGSLNTATLDDLRGRVVVVFSGNGLASLHGAYGPDDGILAFRNLQSGGRYAANFDGLQYYGKGGTSPWKTHKKIRQNEKKQHKLMNEAKAVAYQNPEVIGMMYWTTTGLIGSIRTRNRGMWTGPNRARFRRLWAQGLEEWTEHMNPLAGLDGGVTTHRFMPNIVMIDFPHSWRCQKIRDLNDLTPRQIQNWANTP